MKGHDEIRTSNEDCEGALNSSNKSIDQSRSSVSNIFLKEISTNERIIAKKSVEGVTNQELNKNAERTKNPPDSSVINFHKGSKRQRKKEKLYISLIARLSKMAYLLEKKTNESDEASAVKELTRLLGRYEKDLLKLIEHFNDTKNRIDSSKTIPLGILKALDKYEDPCQWIQDHVFNKEEKIKDKIRGSFYSLGSLQSTLKKRLDDGFVDHACQPDVT